MPPLIEAVFDEVQGRVRGEPDANANDRRFATAIYRAAVMEGHRGSDRLRQPRLIRPKPTLKMAKLKLIIYTWGALIHSAVTHDPSAVGVVISRGLKGIAFQLLVV